MVLQPEFLWSHREDESKGEHEMFGAVLCTAGTACSAIGALILRRVGEVDSFVILIIYAICCCFLSVV